MFRHSISSEEDVCHWVIFDLCKLVFIFSYSRIIRGSRRRSRRIEWVIWILRTLCILSGRRTVGKSSAMVLGIVDWCLLCFYSHQPALFQYFNLSRHERPAILLISSGPETCARRWRGDVVVGIGVQRRPHVFIWVCSQIRWWWSHWRIWKKHVPGYVIQSFSSVE